MRLKTPTAFTILALASLLSPATSTAQWTLEFSQLRQLLESPLLSDTWTATAAIDGESDADPDVDRLTVSPLHSPAEFKLTPEEQIRKAKIAKCRAIYFQKQVNADVLRPWSIMHGLIGSGQDTLVRYRGKTYRAFEYLCANGTGDGMQILACRDGQLETRQGPGVQGHEGQLLAILAQCHVPADQPLYVDGYELQLADLIRYEQWTCRSNTELTFKLIGLAYYLPPDAAWTNQSGERWTMERLIREEAKETINSGACGGAHRLMAFSQAVRQAERAGLPLDGEWMRADAITQAYIARTWQLQNPDGSFSSNFFAGRGNDPSLTRALYTTGHILEWLAYTLPAEQLREPRVTAAVDYLVNRLLSAPGHEVDVGPRGHSLHALSLYERKVFGSASDQTDMNLAVHQYELLKERYAGLMAASAKQPIVAPTADSESTPASRSRRPQPTGIFRRR